MNLCNEILNFKNKLKAYHADLEAEKKKSVHATTWSRYNTAYEFLSSYDDAHILYQAQITSDLIAATPYLRNAVVMYYNSMCKANRALFHYPPLHKKIKTYKLPTKSKLPTVDMKTIQRHVESLYRSQQGILACDLWTATCMGFRRSELVKIYFRNPKGEFAVAIKIVEKKNKHVAKRIVPDSLKRLIELTQAAYPISPTRFQEVRKYCL